MKVLITALFVLALCSTAFAQTQVTVTGDVMGATRGYVAFRLMPWSSSIHYFVPNVTTIVTQEVRCGINTQGQVVNTALTGPCLVWGNDIISPANTTYTVIFAPNNQVANTIARESITNTTYDLNSPVFAAIVTLVPQVTSITAPPLNANLVPAADGAFAMGSPTRKYSIGYFNHLVVDNFTLGSQNIASMAVETLSAGTLNVANNTNLSGSLTLNGQSGSAGQFLRNALTGGPNRTLEFANPAALAAADYAFTPAMPQVNLTAGTAATVTVSPCWLGFDGTSGHYYVYLSGGVGVAEAARVTGGSCTSGAATGTVSFTPQNNHTGAWTIGPATAGIQEAVNMLGQNGGRVILPAGRMAIYETVWTPAPVQFDGQGNASVLLVNSSGITGTAQNYFVFQTATTAACQFYSFEIDASANPQTAGGGIYLDGVNGTANHESRVAHVSMNYVWDAFHSAGASLYSLEANTFFATQHIGAFINNSINEDDGDTTLSDNFFFNVNGGNPGTGSVAGAAAIYVVSGGTKIIGNKINSFSECIDVNPIASTIQLVVVGNTCDGFGSYGIRLRVTGNTFWTDSRIIGNGLFYWQNNGIGISTESNNIQIGMIEGNLFNPYTGVTGSIGFQTTGGLDFQIASNHFNVLSTAILNSNCQCFLTIAHNDFNSNTVNINNGADVRTEMNLAGNPIDNLGILGNAGQVMQPTGLFTGNDNNNTDTATLAVIDTNQSAPGGGTLFLAATKANALFPIHGQASAGGVGSILFGVDDGTTYKPVAQIQGVADSVAPNNTPGSINFFTTPVGATTAARAGEIDSSQNLIWNGTGANLPANATSKFIYMSGVAGAPTGIPARIYGGNYPMVYDATGNRICVYNGAWRCTVLN